jgi:hypothetical protein
MFKKKSKFIILASVILLLLSVKPTIGQNANDCQSKHPGYSCVDITKNKTTECYSGLCSGPIEIQCCINDSLVGSLSADCRDSGNCEVNDFIRIFTYLYTRLLGLAGSLALLMFVYGGLMFLISGGSSERVTKAKQIIVASVIGLVIIFTSFMIIDFVMAALGYDSRVFGEWFKTP